MRDVGTVVKTYKNYADVKVDKKDACSKCGMCLFSGNVDHTVMTCENILGAKAGDEVVIDVKGKGKLLSIFLLFVVPLILIGLSVLISLVVIKNELWTVILSVLSVALWYVTLIPIDKKLKTRQGFIPCITEIINKGETQ